MVAASLVLGGAAAECLAVDSIPQREPLMGMQVNRQEDLPLAQVLERSLPRTVQAYEHATKIMGWQPELHYCQRNAGVRPREALEPQEHLEIQLRPLYNR